MRRRLIAFLFCVMLSLCIGCQNSAPNAVDSPLLPQQTPPKKTEKPQFTDSTMSEAEFVELLTPYLDWRVYEIRNTESDVKPAAGGTAYYVSNSGSNANDGLSPSTPLENYNGAVSKGLKSGDVVYFKRGDIWRGAIKLNISGVSLSAYGEGEKPLFTRSVKDGANPSFWQQTDVENVWVFDTRISDDVGTIIFDDKEWAFKTLYKEYSVTNSRSGRYVNTYKDLDEDLYFFHNFRDGKIYLRSDKGNPGERFEKIEFNVGGNMISVTADNIVIDNLCLKYCGAHGVGADATDGLTVQNCELGWIGGSFQNGWQYETRFGNAVEIWGSAKNFKVDNNYIYQIYDTAITFQYRGAEVSNMHYVQYTNNVADKCTSCVEFWSGGADGSDIKDFLMADNLFIRSGYGMGSQRPVKRGTINLTSGGFMNKLTGYFKIENNVIALSKIQLINFSSGSGDVPELSGNVFAHHKDKIFGQYKDKVELIRFDSNIKTFVNNTMADKNAKVIYLTD